MRVMKRGCTTAPLLANAVYAVTMSIGCTDDAPMALAGTGEVLVSSTTRDLVAGSGLDFEDRGEHELKGIDGMRRVFAAR